MTLQFEALKWWLNGFKFHAFVRDISLDLVVSFVCFSNIVARYFLSCSNQVLVSFLHNILAINFDTVCHTSFKRQYVYLGSSDTDTVHCFWPYLFYQSRYTTMESHFDLIVENIFLVEVLARFNVVLNNFIIGVRFVNKSWHKIIWFSSYFQNKIKLHRLEFKRFSSSRLFL